MPTYAYACTECGHQFDVVQSFSEDSLTTCPECSGRLRKQFNAVGVVFKGGGFYKNDSRSDAGSSRPSGSSSETNGSSGDSSSSSSSDSSGSGSSSSSSSSGSGSSTSSTTSSAASTTS
ncbi:FmdB family transcriptional regulator [Janibacter cremeus]|nr:FmdB family zinc ribbon protein [Janibacter cremeus]WEV77809.1 FmdB family transcriptional regulator [Janibacter cremeus]